MSDLLTSEPFEVCIDGTHGLVIPDEIATPFTKAGHKRVQLNAFFQDNKLTFHGTLHHYLGRYLISFGKRYQKELGVDTSDFFKLQLTEDRSKYGVEISEELQAVLDSDPEASDIFESFTPGMKRSLIYYVGRFKSSQTRIDKALIITENIKLGITDKREIVKSRYYNS